MLTRPQFPLILAQYNIYLVAMSPNSHEKVVRLDIAMNEIFVVNVLDPTDHLVGQHQH